MVRRRNRLGGFSHLAPEYSTTFAPERPWHLKEDPFYHLCTNCERGQTGIGGEVEWGTGDKELCRICEGLIVTRRCNVAYATRESARRAQARSEERKSQGDPDSP